MVIRAEKLRWLFWLRWRLFVRGFTRDWRRIVTAILWLLLIIPFVGGLAVGTYFAYRYLPAPANTAVLFFVLTGVYLAWIMLPLLEFSTNEGLDVSKLMPFPLTRAELAVSLLCSTLLDIPTLGLLLLFAAVVVGWASSLPVILLTLGVLLIFYVQVVGMSQLVLALLMRTLQSRRFRDLTIILIILFSTSCGLLGQLLTPLISGLSRHGGFSGVMQFASYLQWLPPGMTGRAIEQATLGNWGLSFVWLGFSLVTCLVVLYLWQLVLARSLSAAEVGGSARTRQRKIERASASIASPQPASGSVPGGRDKSGPYQRLLSPQVLAIAVKEFKYLWRDPQLKALLFQPVIFIVVFVIAPLFNPSTARGIAFGGIAVLFYPMIAFLSVFTLSYNSLGLERQSLTTLFLFPIDPQRILRGKNLAAFALGAVELVLIVALSIFLSQAWNLLVPALAIGLSGMGVVLGCSNFSSVFLPQYMPTMQRGFRATGLSSGAGCLRSVLTLVMMLVTVIVLIPVILALILPLVLRIEWVWTFTVPAVLIYGAFFYWLVTRLVAPHLLARTPEILAVTTRE